MIGENDDFGDLVFVLSIIEHVEEKLLNKKKRFLMNVFNRLTI